MKWVKVVDDMPLAEVIDVLSALSELDLLIKVESLRHDGHESVSAFWTSENNISQREETFRSLLRGVRHFFESMYENRKERLKDPSTIEALVSIMTFIHEAATKIEKYTPLFKKDKALRSLHDLQELQELKEYYSSAIAPHVSDEKNGTDWEVSWGAQGMDLSETSRRGLVTLKDLRDDRFYDLFYLLQEDGRPFYDFDMVKRGYMLFEIDRNISTEEIEGLFSKIALVEDRRAHDRALHLLHSCSYLIDDFLKDALKFKDSQCVSSLLSALIALLFAANPRNLKQTSLCDKTALHYFLDFVFYMRACLLSEQYEQLLSLSSERRPFQATLYLLSHKLIFTLFTHTTQQAEVISVLKRMISEGLSMLGRKDTGSSLLIEQDRAIRKYLSIYNTGSLAKLCELFENRENAKGFDPLMQKNLPEALFSFNQENETITCLKIPSLCRQEYIHKAEIIKEFDSLMRSFHSSSKQMHLLYVGLQDRTSWQDYARCTAVEQMAKKEQYYKNITLFCLAKHTDFYHQTAEFSQDVSVEDFLHLFYEQFAAKELSGFYITESLQAASIKELTPIMRFVKEIFFSEKKSLCKEDRMAFIDITYLFLIAHANHACHAQFLAFCDKDGIDGAAAMSALWYGFCTLFTHFSLDEKKVGHLLYMLYSPALVIRERAVDEVEVKRVSLALSTLQAGCIRHKKKITKAQDQFTFLKFLL